MKLDSSLKSAYADSCGNTFILLDKRESGFELSHQLIVHLCESRGVDGLIVFTAQKESASTYAMHYYNRDGYEAELCGNGLASLGAWIYQLDGCKALQIVSRAGKHSLEVQKSESGELSVRCEMPKIEDIEKVELDGETLFVARCGVPHALLLTSNSSVEAAFASHAKYFRNHPYFKRRGGVNVSALSLENGQVVAQTFERGVEAVTLSCGTGACVIAHYAHTQWDLKFPIEVKMPGGSLFVDTSKNGELLPVLICKPSLEVKALY